MAAKSRQHKKNRIMCTYAAGNGKLPYNSDL